MIYIFMLQVKNPNLKVMEKAGSCIYLYQNPDSCSGFSKNYLHIRASVKSPKILYQIFKNLFKKTSPIFISSFISSFA